MTRLDELINRFLDDGLEPGERLELEGAVRVDPRAVEQFVDYYQQDRLLSVLCRPSQAPAIDAVLAAVIQEDRFVDTTMRQAHTLAIEGFPVKEGRSVGADGEQRRISAVIISFGSWAQRFFLRPVWAVALALVVFVGLILWWFPHVNNQPILSLTVGTRVALQRNGSFLPADDGMRLLPGDLIKVGGTNQVRFIYGTEATSLGLLGDTELKVLSWTKGKQLELHLGRIDTIAARQRPFRPMLLRTPQAEARVLGTKFTLAVTTNATRLEVTQGTVRFTRLSDNSNAVVRAGNYAVAAVDYELRAQPVTGGILREYWTNMPGELWINTLTSNPNYPDHPSGREYLNQFEAPSNWGKDYGARICGFVHPPRTGDYTFWLSGSEGTGLWLSPNDDPRRARQVATARNAKPHTWTEERFQQSPTIHLVAGRKYYIQALQKHGRGSDHLAVAWKGPGLEREIIPGEFLSPLKPQPKEEKP